MENYHIIIDKKMLKQTNGKRSTGPARYGKKKKKSKAFMSKTVWNWHINR